MKEQDYDKDLRALGYVDSGLSGSRGDYFIISYRPGAKKKHRMVPGLVEVHIWNKLFEIHTPRGKFTGQKALSEAVAALQM